jgi:hypothetical protein
MKFKQILESDKLLMKCIGYTSVRIEPPDRWGPGCTRLQRFGEKKIQVIRKGADDEFKAAHRGIAASMNYLLFSSNSFCLRGGLYDRPLSLTISQDA